MNSAFAPGLGCVPSFKGRGELCKGRTCASRTQPPRAAARRASIRGVTMARSSYDFEAAEINAGAAAEATTAADIDMPSTGWSPPGSGTAKNASVQKQMEFWFSPSNLKRDWYLRRQMDDEGWLDPAIFLKFNRLKQLNASLTEVIEACKGSDLLEVSAPPTDGTSFGDNLGQTRVRRSTQLPPVSDELEAESERSIVVENIPNEMLSADLRRLFSEYGTVVYSWMSKPSPKDPARYSIISFESTLTAVEALDSFDTSPPGNAPPGMTVKSKVLWDAIQARHRNKSVVVQLSGLPVSLEWREIWDDIKTSFDRIGVQVVYCLYKNGTQKCYVTLPHESAGELFEQELCHDGETVVCGTSVQVHILTTDDELDGYWEMASAQILERKKRKEKYALSQIAAESSDGAQTNPEGVIVKITGLPGVGWQALMTSLRELGEVVFLNFKRDADVCFVRYIDAEVASGAVASLSGPDRQLLLDTEVEAVVLEGEEEVEYWERAAEDRKRKRSGRQKHRFQPRGERQHED